jgi:antitoxin (DNA-binding transcriptional repressor) of toxin-antitoxin stability system
MSEAQQRLPELLAAAEAGETVEIRGPTGRAVRLLAQPLPPAFNPPWPGYPCAVSAKGLIEVPDDFDESLDELKEELHGIVLAHCCRFGSESSRRRAICSALRALASCSGV